MRRSFKLIKPGIQITGFLFLFFIVVVPVWSQTPTPSPTATPTELPLNCDFAIPLTCGSSVSGDNSSKPSYVAMYGCLFRDATAGEDIYSATVAADSLVTFQLTGMSVDLDIYLLEFCNDETCLAFGDTEITFILV